MPAFTTHRFLASLVDSSDSEQGLRADSAYVGQEKEKVLDNDHIINQIVERAYKNKPLTEKQKK